MKECGTCEGARECVDRLRLRVISATPTLSGEDPIVKAAQEAIAEQPQAVADFQAGKKEALNFLVGQVMKKTRGCAKPGDVNKVLSDLLEEA